MAAQTISPFDWPRFSATEFPGMHDSKGQAHEFPSANAINQVGSVGSPQNAKKSGVVDPNSSTNS
eukprot:901234-Amphidinium_carterae.2